MRRVSVFGSVARANPPPAPCTALTTPALRRLPRSRRTTTAFVQTLPAMKSLVSGVPLTASRVSTCTAAANLVFLGICNYRSYILAERQAPAATRSILVEPVLDDADQHRHRARRF